MLNLSLSAQDCVRQLVGKNGDKDGFLFGSIGIGSYINSITMQVTQGDEVVNLQIGNYCSISHNILCLFNRDHDYKSVSNSVYMTRRKLKRRGQILIGNDVWIGTNAIILPGNTIGNGAVIGAGAVVSKDIPPYSIAVGNPVRVVKYRFYQEQIEQLTRIKWWHWPPELVKERSSLFFDIDEFISHFCKQEEQVKPVGIQKKALSFLFYPDFDDPYPLWPKVIKEYISKFKADDDATLLLRVPPTGELAQNVQKITSFLPKDDDFPDILIVTEQVEDERSLFCDVDYFITSRLIDNTLRVEMACDLSVSVLSGVDEPILI